MMATQAVLALLETSANATSAEAGWNGTSPILQSLSAFLPQSLIPLLTAVLSSSALRDWLKLIVLGTVFEGLRRLLASGWDGFVDTLFVHVRIEKEDDAFEWLVLYFSKHPAFQTTRRVTVSTRQRGSENYMEGCNCADCMSNRPAKEDLIKRLSYLPAYNCSYSFRFYLTWITVERTRESLNPLEGLNTEGLNLRILKLGFGGARSVITKLLTEAKDSFDKEEDQKISVYVGDQYGAWRRAGSKLRRPWSSVVLEEGVKELVLADAKEYMQSQAWYVERGIPYRRGYLLHGVPGSGKTSLIHALAGELKLDIFVISLSKKSLDDQALNDMVTNLPPSCIALMEDIDCAFKKGVTSRSGDDKDSSSSSLSKDKDDKSSPHGITLSGLLNAIDGIAAHEGRLLFATTNVPDTLDPALIRPGRMDLAIEFKNSTKKQAEELFKRFFLSSPDAELEAGDEKEKDALLLSVVPRAVKKELPPTPPGTPRPSNPATPLITSATLHTLPTPRLTVAERDLLAARFAAGIPEREFSMASLQGYLMQHKVTPHRCVEEVAQWVVKERESVREKKARKEEEERRAAEEERKEREKKEKEEKEAKEKEEKEKENTKEEK